MVDLNDFKKEILNDIDNGYPLLDSYAKYKFRLGMFYGYMLGSFLMFIFMLIISVVD